MYIINKPVELTKVKKINAEEIFLAENIYYIKAVDTYYYMDKDMLKKIAIADRTGLCIKAYRELEEMQLLTMQGVTDIKGFKIIVVEEVRDIKEELTEMIEDKPVKSAAVVVSKPVEVVETVSKRKYTQAEVEYLYMIGEIDLVKKIIKAPYSNIDIEAFKKEVFDVRDFREIFGDEPKKLTAKKFCTNCCGTCSDCPYMFNDEGIITDEYFIRWC